MFDHSEITYNPLQIETEKYIEEDCNIVCLAPTSSGKTIVSEQYLGKALSSNLRAVYLSPLKALTNERLNDWSDKIVSIMAVTGDHMLTPKPINKNLILMTTEALDSKTRGQQNWLHKVGAIVSDESHLLGAEGRGDAFEVGLTRFAHINPSARIIFLSATIPNTSELAAWLTKLNGKPTKVVSTKWRPVEQEYFLRKLPNKNTYFQDRVLKEIGKIRSKYKEKQVLIFVHTVAMGNAIKSKLGIPFHYSKVELEERHRIERAFRQKEIRTLVATSTLAYGINFPADVGIIVGAHRGPMEVDPVDLKQEAGRIGRYGLSERGYVYFLFMERHADEMYQKCLETPNIISVLPQRLYFHITSFISRESMSIDEIKQFLSKTLAYEQHFLEINEALQILLDYEIIYRDQDSYSATKLGRAAALMYMDPIDLYYMAENLSSKPTNPEELAIALTNIPSNQIHSHVPSLKAPIDLYYGKATIQATCLRDWLSGKPLEGLHSTVVPPLIKDIERVTSALTLAGVPKDYLDNIILMVKNGVNDEIAPLTELKGLGRSRALRLYNHGIKAPKEIVENQKLATNILGKKTFDLIKQQVEAKEGTVFLFY